MDVEVPGLQPARKRDPQPHTREELSSEQPGGAWRQVLQAPSQEQDPAHLPLDFFILPLGGSQQRPKQSTH